MSINYQSKGQFSILVEFVVPYKNALYWATLLMLGVSLIALLNPWLAGQVTESLLMGDAVHRFTFRQLLLIWLVVLAVQGLLNFGNHYLVGITGEKMLAELRTRLYDHIQSLPLSYFHERKRGKVLSLLTNDADILSYFVTGTIPWILPQFVTLIGALLIIFLIDPVIGLIIGFLLPLFYFVMKVIGRKIRPTTRAMLDEYSNIIALIEENLQLLPVIKSFTRESMELKRLKERSLKLVNLTGRYLRIQSMLSPIVHFLAAAAILLLLWVSSFQIESGQLTVPELVSLLLYGMLLTSPISGLADLYGQVQHTRAAAERLVDVFSFQREPGADGEQPLTAINGQIEFRNVHFDYPGRDAILCGLNLTIQAGETVAITGRNGSGKSTLAYLLQRFADPVSGQIVIDGIDISKVSLFSLRSQIGVVPQQVLILNGTVRDNICYGRPEANESMIEAAAKAAHALEFIKTLPDGFETVVGDEGIKLSGGQRQRLALTRALLKDSSILILDEATAMFDPEGEKIFIKECHEILHQRTVILITHRPASLALADRVLRLENGVIVNANEDQGESSRVIGG